MLINKYEIKMSKLTISLVVYYPDKVMLANTITTLVTACKHTDVIPHLVFVDNSESPSGVNEQWVKEYWGGRPLTFYVDKNNPGFGVSHNRALNVTADYNLILNPDVELDPHALSESIQFMESNSDCDLITPYATWPDGSIQRLCKRYPSIFIFLLRAWGTEFLKKVFRRYLGKYEMRDELDDSSVFWDPPIVSGCFMFFRHNILKNIGGFDSRYFLYFEDFDLSLRVNKISRIAYVPQVKIIHYGGNTARKGWWHIRVFSKSMVLFFRTHGWKIF